MKLPLKITLRHMEASPALEGTIRRRAGKLDAQHSLTRCEVLLEAPHKHGRNGRLYTVHLTATVPGAEIVVSRAPDLDPYVAVRKAFEAARRQIGEKEDRRRARRAA